MREKGFFILPSELFCRVLETVDKDGMSAVEGGPDLNEILSAATGQPLKRVKQDTERDNYMRAAEALEYGLIDRVMTTRGAAANGKDAE